MEENLNAPDGQDGKGPQPERGGLGDSPRPQRSLKPKPDQPQIPDHTLLRCIGQGSYGEVWLARNVMGTLRAVKIVYRERFTDERPYERELRGIQKFEPISRSHDGFVDILQVGHNDTQGYFYYVMELADDASQHPNAPPSSDCGAASKCRDPKEPRTTNEEARHPGLAPAPANFEFQSSFVIRHSSSYQPHTLGLQLECHGRLPVAECIRIGESLASALEFLHQNGLVHRDIKPANIIFVNGQPKLADIGSVAELGSARSLVGTEGFIPPEGPGTSQADIYSLGKVLYEMSSGKDRHAFPAPPTRLGELSDRHELLELNAVIQRACEGDTRKRYASAAAMRQELLVVEAGQSVRRLHAAERRLRAITRAAAIAAVVLAIAVPGFLVALRQAQHARLAQGVAKLEADRSQRVAMLLKQTLNGIAPVLGRGGDAATIKGLVDQAAERVSKEWAGQPDAAVEMRKTLGELYSELGESAAAERMYAGALAIITNRAGIPQDETADLLRSLAASLYEQRKLDVAERALLQTLAIYKKLHGEEHQKIAQWLGDMATLREIQGALPEAEQLNRDALAMKIKVFGQISEEVSDSMCDLSGLLKSEDKLVEAEKWARDCLDLRRKIHGPESHRVANTLEDLAAILAKEGRLEDAQTYQQQALALRRRILSSSYPQLARSLEDLARLLWQQGKLVEAEKRFREIIELREGLPLSDEIPRHRNLAELAGVLRDQDKLKEAEARMEEALTIAGQLHSASSAEIASWQSALADMLERREKPDAAEPHARLALAYWEKENPNQWQRFWAKFQLGIISLRQDRETEAQALLESGYQGLEQRRQDIPSADMRRLILALQRLADCYAAHGRPLQATEWKHKLLSFNELVNPAQRSQLPKEGSKDP